MISCNYACSSLTNVYFTLQLVLISPFTNILPHPSYGMSIFNCVLCLYFLCDSCCLTVRDLYLLGSLKQAHLQYTIVQKEWGYGATVSPVIHRIFIDIIIYIYISVSYPYLPPPLSLLWCTRSVHVKITNVQYARSKIGDWNLIIMQAHT